MQENVPVVLLAYNETNPEMYIYKSELEKSNLNFTPYFEIDNTTPMEEFVQMADAIRAQGFIVHTLNMNDDFSVLYQTVQDIKPDVIFNCVEILYGQARLEMAVAGFLELTGIPYTGAPPMALANCQNKLLTKEILLSDGIQTPEYRLVEHPSQVAGMVFPPFPLIVKPLYEDASVGIENASVVNSVEELTRRVEFVLSEFKEPSLVEAYIEGRELNVAVFGDTNPVVLPISEIDFSTMPENLAHIVSYQAKWDPTHESYHKTIPVCPANLSEEQRVQAEKVAFKAFKTLGLRDYARVDMRLTNDNEIYVLEVNPNPDLSDGAGFMRSADAAGYPYAVMLGMLIRLALNRKLN
ncbi:MAG: ATP-grasp domain-containing protein [Ignavibacteria bacterium]|nr:ATP-grasp domain-containing protein [Ignavibacteria bacterium]